MKKRGCLPWLVVFFVLVIAAAILFPVLVPHGQPSRKVMCMSNMKELAWSFAMYTRDNNDMLPSSAVCGSLENRFRKVVGKTPVGARRPETVFQLLYPYRQNEHILFCPSDPDQPMEPGPGDRSSYVLKEAINDAWIDPKVKARKTTNYRHPAEQILFYERSNFHWGADSGDLGQPGMPKRFPVSFNCVFMNGHVKTHRLNATDRKTYNEPDYYNWNMKTNKPAANPEIDPRVYGDVLR